MTPDRTATATGRSATGRVAGGGMDPRIRQRRAAVARTRGRRRFRVLIAVLVVVALVVVAWLVLHSGLFAARALTVTGSEHTPASQVEAAAGLSTHPPLLDVDTGAAAAAVERLPWVESATVSLDWPDGAHVVVVERTPVAVVAVPSGPTEEVDGTGRVLATVAAPIAGLPQLELAPAVTGVDLQAPPGAGLPRSAPVAAGLRVAATLPAAFRSQVTAVTVAPGPDVVLQLTTPVTVDLGSTNRLHAKYVSAAAMLAGAALHPGDVVDVRAPGAPVVTGP